MELDKRNVKRQVNKNTKYRHYSAQNWEENYYNSENRTSGFKSKEAKPKFKKKKLSSSMIQYREYLISDYWKKVRKAALKRDGYKCKICNDNSKLEVHHLSYANKGNELKHMGDVMTLCKKCHVKIHQIPK